MTTGTTAMTATPGTEIIRKPTVQTAVQWTGENIAEIQAYMQPSSPLYNFFPPELMGKYMNLGRPADSLQILVRDTENEAKFPNLGPQFRIATASVGDWISKVADSVFVVIHADEYAREWVPVVANPLVAGHTRERAQVSDAASS